MLIDAKADVHKAGDLGSPIGAAQALNNSACVAMLVAANADPGQVWQPDPSAVLEATASRPKTSKQRRPSHETKNRPRRRSSSRRRDSPSKSSKTALPGLLHSANSTSSSSENTATAAAVAKAASNSKFIASKQGKQGRVEVPGLWDVANVPILDGDVHVCNAPDSSAASASAFTTARSNLDHVVTPRLIQSARRLPPPPKPKPSRRGSGAKKSSSSSRRRGRKGHSTIKGNKKRRGSGSKLKGGGPGSGSGSDKSSAAPRLQSKNSKHAKSSPALQLPKKKSSVALPKTNKKRPISARF